MSVISVFFEKNIFWVSNENWQKKKTDMSRIKGVGKKKKCHVENDEKKRVLRKMFVWIKDDRDSVTRPKTENLKK